MQGSNYTQALKDEGLKTPSELINVYDINPMGGGRIIRDKLWFYTTYRQIGGEKTVPGMWSTGTPATRTPGPSTSTRAEQAFTDSLERQATVRLTWQATPRNKFNVHWSEQYNDANYGRAAARRRRRRKRRAGRSTTRPVNPTPPGRRR